jgi:hypothetical protein
MQRGLVSLAIGSVYTKVLVFALLACSFALEAHGQRRQRRRVRRRARRCMCATVSNAAPTVSSWRTLFDGATLADWKSAEFGGEGEVHVENGAIILDYGNSLTGVTYTGADLPKTNYEIELEAKRIDGIDFFCALTFPVADSYCSFVVSGWAGTVVGLSSIDGFDASDNETTQYMDFKNNQWYRIRVEVTATRIRAWIDNEKIVDQDIEGRRISTRAEVDLSQPLGISAFESQAALRNIRIRPLVDR